MFQRSVVKLADLQKVVAPKLYDDGDPPMFPATNAWTGGSPMCDARKEMPLEARRRSRPRLTMVADEASESAWAHDLLLALRPPPAESTRQTLGLSLECGPNALVSRMSKSASSPPHPCVADATVVERFRQSSKAYSTIDRSSTIESNYSIGSGRRVRINSLVSVSSGDLEAPEAAFVPEVKTREFRGPFCLADVSRRWGLPLDTVKASSEIFQQFAKLPGLDADEDILRHGQIHHDDLIHVLCKLSECNVENLPPGTEDSVMKVADQNRDGTLDFQEFAGWYQQRCFMEFVNLSPIEREMRRVGQRLGLSSAEMDHYKALFDKYDTDHSGFIDLGEFTRLLHALMKIPRNLTIPQNRVMHFWNECDADGSGEVDLEEFVSFYIRHFDPESLNPMMDFYKSVRPV